MSSSIRAEEIHFLVKQLFGSFFEAEQKVQVKSFFYMPPFNIMMKVMVGKRYFEDELGSEGAKDMYNDITQLFTLTADSVVLGECFPFPRWLSFKGEEEAAESV